MAQARCGPTLGEGDPIKVRELDDEHAEARFVVGEIERLVDEGVSRAEIAVFYRTNAQSRVLEDTLVRARDRLPGHRRHEVLRARRDQGRDRLPDVPRQPAGRRRVHARRQLAAARDRADVALARARARRHDGHRGLGGGRATRRRCPGLGTAAVKALGRFMATMARAARARSSSGVPVGDLLEAVLHETGYLDALEAERTIEAQGRIENLEELVEVGARVRRRADAEGDTLDEFLQQIALRRRRRHAPRRRGPRDADDAAQRQGPRVPDRLHDRLRGGRLPALARARRGRRSRRSAGSATSASRARCATSTSPTRAAATSSARRRYGLPQPLPRRDPAASSTDREGAPPASAPARGAGRAGARGRDVVGGAAQAPTPPGADVPARRRRRPRRLRRRRRDRRRAGRDRRRALRRRRLASASSWPTTRRSRSSAAAQRMTSRSPA